MKNAQEPTFSYLQYLSSSKVLVHDFITYYFQHSKTSTISVFFKLIFLFTISLALLLVNLKIYFKCTTPMLEICGFFISCIIFF